MTDKYPVSTQQLDREYLYAFLSGCPTATHYLLALSGGLDSSVLLHLFSRCQENQFPVPEIIHIDHGLQDNSNEWADFCARQAQQYGFRYHVYRLDSRPGPGESIENWARNARYSLIQEHMQTGSIVFTAHHLDDQVETFFLRSLRGSGPRGLAAMSDLREFGPGHLARPLLPFSRSQILQYVKSNKLKWIEDPSNNDTSLDRNFLRHEVLPGMQEQWPSMHKTIARLISHQQETSRLLDEIAAADLATVLDEHSQSVNVKQLKQFSVQRQKNMLGFWVKNRLMATPDNRHLQEVIEQLILAETDSSPCVNWGDVIMRRYRQRIYLFQSEDNTPDLSETSWDTNEPLQLNGETLQANITTGNGIAERFIIKHTVKVCYRRGGETIRPVTRSMTRTVKQLFQESGVFPWYRERYPLIYIDDKLAEIPGICIDENFAAAVDERAIKITWSGQNKSREYHE